MKVSETFYNEDGELMAPRSVDVVRKSAAPGGLPTLEAGFYHRFKFEGRTKDEYDDKCNRFFAQMRNVQGYMTLVARPYTVEMGSYVRFGLDVLYAVESAEQAAAAAQAATAATRPTTASRVQASTAITSR
jgi:hypothetical protein